VSDPPAHLPERVRRRVLEVASATLAALPDPDVPPSLRQIRRFTPAKRLRLGASAIASVLEADPGFRDAAAEVLRTADPDLAEAVERGEPPAAAPAEQVAAAAFLLRPEGWRGLIAAAAERLARDAPPAADRPAAAPDGAKEVRRLREQLAATRAAARTDADELRRSAAAHRAEAGELRRRLREAEAEAAKARAAVAEARTAAEQREADAATELRRLRAQLADLEAALDASRRASRSARDDLDTRTWLLLDTLVRAAQGLRRELALPPAERRPADAVLAEWAADWDAGPDPFAAVPGRGDAADDPALLDRLLSVPNVHLLVDGYNVTKAGYGELTLDAQRSRLLAGLGPLGARTGAEVTVVFDGAAVSAPPATVRGVRVVFSPPGESADSVLRRLTRAEPPGRPLVVVSTDREVARDVTRLGARAVPSAALLRLLGCG
jgi:hypothetical protein